MVPKATVVGGVLGEGRGTVTIPRPFSKIRVSEEQHRSQSQ